MRYQYAMDFWCCLQLYLRLSAAIGEATMQPHTGLIGDSGLTPAANANVRVSYRDRAGLCDWQFKRVIAYLSIRIGSSVRVSDLAAEVNLSPSHFARAFTIRLGLSPYTFIMKLRIERARALLVTSDKSLAEIAFNCGLSDQAHFNRFFRRFVGMPPSQWRRQQLTEGRAGSQLSLEYDSADRTYHSDKKSRFRHTDHAEPERFPISA
ncbi:AraC family transcriptional regulator [Pararhizobium sp. BT-229]|uniref:helix-turn-helix domain-containing protein n=1 Tax=Pararhizobium sp. BT-229 TaxID=2986923 RepID=UPI0021F7FCCE|nr:AraC family transcriptional regulator [Pararhizobium sp. BT-229]MCV9966750.1 AraC family transcriptional regulator [Pararhizobium sp. BT-229]